MAQNIPRSHFDFILACGELYCYFWEITSRLYSQPILYVAAIMETRRNLLEFAPFFPAQSPSTLITGWIIQLKRLGRYSVLFVQAGCPDIQHLPQFGYLNVHISMKVCTLWRDCRVHIYTSVFRLVSIYTHAHEKSCLDSYVDNINFTYSIASLCPSIYLSVSSLYHF